MVIKYEHSGTSIEVDTLTADRLRVFINSLKKNYFLSYNIEYKFVWLFCYHQTFQNLNIQMKLFIFAPTVELNMFNFHEASPFGMN